MTTELEHLRSANDTLVKALEHAVAVLDGASDRVAHFATLGNKAAEPLANDMRASASKGRAALALARGETP